MAKEPAEVFSVQLSHDHSKSPGPLRMVSAWSVERAISLGQLATEEKSNEITAIPQRIEESNVEDEVVMIDAAGFQKRLPKRSLWQVKTTFCPQRKSENDAQNSSRFFHQAHGK